MSVLCGTDFSGSAGAAARVAAAIATGLGLPLKLVHVIEIRGAERPGSGARDDLAHERLRRLQEEAGGLRTGFGLEIEVLTEYGVADEVLVALASRFDARLLVLGSLGERRQQLWLLGSVAERVAQASPVPVLVVRDGAGLEAWAGGLGTLRVAVGVEKTPASEAAVQWTRGLRAIGPCEIMMVQIVWPAEEHHRMGVPTPIPLDHLRPEVERELLRELGQWAGDDGGPGETSFVVRPGWGRADRHLTQLAAESDVDLLVVGTHQRAGIARLWQGSVSRGALHAAPMSVACVPRRREPAPDGKAR